MLIFLNFMDAFEYDYDVRIVCFMVFLKGGYVVLRCVKFGNYLSFVGWSNCGWKWLGWIVVFVLRGSCLSIG